MKCRCLLGVAMLACLVTGGGTVRNLAVDSALQIAMICTATYAIIKHWERPASPVGLLLFALMFFSGLLQIIPLPSGFPHGLKPEIFRPTISGPASGTAFETISIGTSRTLSAWMNGLGGIYLFIAFSKLPERDLLGLLPFYLCGLIANLAVVFLGYSSELHGGIGSIFGYRAASGFFANDNHLSTLLCASIPVITWLGASRRRKTFWHLLTLFVLVCLLAVGSRAGILIGLAVFVLSLFQRGGRSHVGRIAALGLLVAVTVYGYAAFVRIGGDEGETMLQRSDFALTTWRGICDNWLLGTGYGTFELAYPHYERLQDIYPAYVNHAHNDFLEIMLEGGTIGAAMLIMYLAAVLVRFLGRRGERLHWLSFLSVCVVLVHSLVDYPLRTMAISVSFALFNALFFLDRNSAILARKR